MVNLIDILESIEQFAYKVLIWILVAPKTLAKIIMEPGWVPTYISKELREKEQNRFDEYFSPVFLILLASVLEFRVAKWRTRDVRLYRTLKTEKQIPVTDLQKPKPEFFCS